MRLGEQCPYITPCGFCSRQEKPCDRDEIKMEIAIKPPVLTEEKSRDLIKLTKSRNSNKLSGGV